MSARQGRPVTLGEIPEGEFVRWQELGITHVWLMGAWSTGPRSRAVALDDSNLRAAAAALLPDAKDSDVTGSPFAVADYRVPRAWGGQNGLKAFRQQLHAHGLQLLLDFVGNHLGLDHPWVIARPELFVPGVPESPAAFALDLPEGQRWLAHGKDPNFPAWMDTAQLDYRRLETHTAMRELFQQIVPLCDGVRCDMAMLLLNDVFARTWESAPSADSRTDREFWADLIAATRQATPEFLFFAEAYWDLEARLQALGFDYAYDKRLCDHLIARNPADVPRHLLGLTPQFLAASAHFLENHDEARITTLLSGPEHRAAALLTLGLPGLRLLHEGQLTGARLPVPVQLNRRPAEPMDLEIAELYTTLLKTLKSTAVGQGSGTLRTPRSAWPGNESWQNLAVVQWQSEAEAFDLVVVNFAPERSQGYVPLAIEGLSQHNWRMKDRLGAEEYLRYGDDLQNQGLYLDVVGHGAQLFVFLRQACGAAKSQRDRLEAGLAQAPGSGPG
jgi:hypothetical protein